MKKLFSLFGVLLLAISVSAQAGEGSKLKEKIEAQNARFMAAFNSGDTETLAGLYTVDAVLMPPGGARGVGKDTIKAAFEGMLGGPKLELALMTDSVEKQGEVVIEVGHWTMKVMPEGADPVMDNGDYLVVWRMGDGAWKLYIDMFNSNNPPGGG